MLMYNNLDFKFPASCAHAKNLGQRSFGWNDRLDANNIIDRIVFSAKSRPITRTPPLATVNQTRCHQGARWRVWLWGWTSCATVDNPLCSCNFQPSRGWNNLLAAICGTFNLNDVQQNKVPPKPQNTRKSLNCRGSTRDPAGGAYNSLDPLSVFWQLTHWVTL